jgi:lipoate-protein ligase A
LIDSGILTPSRSVAVDEALLEGHGHGSTPDTVHFYTRSQPTVSIGQFQKVGEAVDLGECARRGVAVVRRRSGGGSIFTDSGQLIFAIVTTESVLGSAPAYAFKAVCGAVAESLRGLGVEAEYRPINDVEAGGRKVSGSAQLRRHGSVLHHGTVIVETDLETMDAVLKCSPVRPSERVTRLCDLLVPPPDVGQVKIALTDGFRRLFAVEFEESELTESESAMVDEYVASCYGNDSWNLKL